MIRVLAGTALAVRVLRALPEGTQMLPHLTSLMLHGKDVVADCRFRPIRKAGDEGMEPGPEEVALMQVPRPLHGLILCVDRILDQAGKGSYPQIDPAALSQFIGQRSYGQRPSGERAPTPQERNLYRQAAAGFTVQWIKEVLSGYVEVEGHGKNHDRSVGARWFADTESGESPALRFLTQSIENERSDQPHLAATLLLQLAPDRFAQIQTAKPSWDWYARRQEMQEAHERNLSEGQPERLVLNANAMLCAPPYSPEQWQLVTPLLERWLADKSGPQPTVYTTMLVARLGAVLREAPTGNDGRYGQWVHAFLDRLRAMVSVTELPRELRGLMIDWIPWRIRGRCRHLTTPPDRPCWPTCSPRRSTPSCSSAHERRAISCS